VNVISQGNKELREVVAGDGGGEGVHEPGVGVMLINVEISKDDASVSAYARHGTTVKWSSPSSAQRGGIGSETGKGDKRLLYKKDEKPRMRQRDGEAQTHRS
jgi:hypothetical protein